MTATSLIGTMGTLITFVGIFMIVIGVIRFMMSIMNEDSEAKTRAFTFLLTGMILIGANSVLGLMSSEIELPEKQDVIIQEVPL